VQLDPVRKGDIVDVVAPASKCTPLELRRAIQEIKALGLKPRVPKNLFGKSELFSNSDDVRLKHLKDAIYARDSKLIWCVRGGYGAIRLMPQIEKWPRPKQAKIFLGFSDITTLHAHFNKRWKWPTLHGPLMDRLGRDAMSAGEKRALVGMIFGRRHGRIQRPEAAQRRRPQKARDQSAGQRRQLRGLAIVARHAVGV
jgi:muramoyltetrapeptide carboxypeptidase